MLKKYCLLLAAAFLAGTALAAENAADGFMKELLTKTGRTAGICSLPRSGGALVLALASNSSLLVHAMATEETGLSLLRKTASEAGLLGSRIYVEKGNPSKLPFADNYIDFLLIADLGSGDLTSLQPKEILRALAPYNGVFAAGRLKTEQPDALLTKEKLLVWAKSFSGCEASVEETAYGLFAYIRKGPLKNGDDWSHFYHNAEGDCFSKDTALKFPLALQWLGKPYLESNFNSSVVASGRLFTVRSSPLFTVKGLPVELVARSAHNGSYLWKKELPADYGTFSPNIAASAKYCIIFKGSSALLLDAETGKEKKEVIFDASPSKQCKWMGLKDNVLFWAIGESPKSKKPEALLLSETKNFATELYAYDLEKNALLWKNNSIGKAERRTICANGEKLFFCDSKKRAVCLDAKTGKELWSVNKEFDAREIGGMDWWMMASNMNAALCTKAAYYLFPMENSMLTAFSAADGRLLFETKRKSYSYLMMEKNKLLSGGGLLYDGQTGKEEKPTWGWRCGPGEVCGHKTATPNGIFKLFGAAWDLENDTAPAAAPVRSACGPGTFVANGVYYAFPNGCFCLYNWRGVIAQSSTETALPAPSKETEALETFPEAGKADEGITGTDEKDWHTYRGNNQRTGAVKAVVPAKASMAWKQLPEKPLKSGDFDNTDEAVSVPVTAGDLVVYGGFDGMLRCYSISSGRSIWNFPAEGRIFGAPSIYEGRVYAGSADGNVYCLGLTSGRLLWRFRAAPADRKILVYGNLMSSWPVNTGILLQDGLVYFSAGLIAEHGTYLYALEAKTGKVKWKVFDTGLKGLASMGHMAVIGKKLLLNGGNAPLGLFDLKNGELKRHVNMAEVSRFNTTRGKEVGVFLDRFILHGGRMLYKDENDFTESREGRAGIAFPFIEYDIKNEKTLPVELNPFQGNLSFAPPAWDSSGFLFASMINNSDTLQYLDSGKFAAALSSGLSGAVTDKKDKKYVYSAKKSIAGNGQDEAKAFLWSFDGNENYAAASICLAENAAVFTYTTKTSLKSDKYWFAAAINRVDGKQLWEEKLPGAPVLGGTAVSRDGSVLVTLRNGGIICIRK